MQRLLIIFGLTVAAIAAIAAYPYIQMTDGKILVTDGKIQFAAAESSYASWFTNITSIPKIQTTTNISMGSNFTICAWVNIPQGANIKTIVATRTEAATQAGDFMLWFRGDNKKAQFYLYDTGFKDILSDDVFPASSWSHIAAIRDGGTISLYVDGIQQAATLANNQALGGNEKVLYIGNQNESVATGYSMNGAIDDLAIYSVALASNEIYQIATTNTSLATLGYTSGMQAYWKFNEGIGTSVADTSGNENNGVMLNGATWTNGYVTAP